MSLLEPPAALAVNHLNDVVLTQKANDVNGGDAAGPSSDQLPPAERSHTGHRSAGKRGGHVLGDRNSAVGALEQDHDAGDRREGVAKPRSAADAVKHPGTHADNRACGGRSLPYGQNIDLDRHESLPDLAKQLHQPRPAAYGKNFI